MRFLFVWGRWFGKVCWVFVCKFWILRFRVGLRTKCTRAFLLGPLVSLLNSLGFFTSRSLGSTCFWFDVHLLVYVLVEFLDFIRLDCLARVFRCVLLSPARISLGFGTIFLFFLALFRIYCSALSTPCPVLFLPVGVFFPAWAICGPLSAWPSTVHWAYRWYWVHLLACSPFLFCTTDILFICISIWIQFECNKWFVTKPCKSVANWFSHNL